MARRKKRKKREAKQHREPLFDDLSPQTKQAIVAVFFAVLAVLFTISLLSSSAGWLGGIINTSLSYLFGTGAWLAPIACILYVITLLRPREDDQVSISKSVGILLLFLSLLVGLEFFREGSGGVIAWLLEKPLSNLFGDVGAGVIIVATTLVGIFLFFNTGLSAFRLWNKKEAVEEDELDEETIEILEDGVEEEKTEEVEDQNESTPKDRTVAEKLGFTKSGDFVVSNFSGPYDPPPLSLLEKDRGKPKVGDVKANSNIIKRTLKNFNIEVEMDEVSIGPTVTRYALKPAEGVRISKIVGLQNNLELALAASPIRIEAPIPGKSLVGVEVPNTSKATVGLASLLMSPEYTDSPKPLLVALGRDISGNVHFANVNKMPHVLIAGTTGSGKSVTIHAFIMSLLFRNSPEQLRFIMVDPKRVELPLYTGIPHLLTPVITDAKKAILSLKWAIKEMERRYDILQTEKVRDINSYHENIYQPARKEMEDTDEENDSAGDMPEPLPYIVIVIDELADLMHAYPREFESSIVRLAQMSRAVGIHLILSTQRPSVNVITGLIKANIPSRIALQVASQIDSRTILDQVGAEKLLGAGDMLFLSSELSKPVRLQSAFIGEEELKKVAGYLKKQASAQELDAINLDGKNSDSNPDAFFESVEDDEDSDELYEDAKVAVVEAGKASTSYLQRKLRIGYSRAARLMDILEERGIIGPADGARPREILLEGREEDGEDEDV